MEISLVKAGGMVVCFPHQLQVGSAVVPNVAIDVMGDNVPRKLRAKQILEKLSVPSDSAAAAGPFATLGHPETQILGVFGFQMGPRMCAAREGGRPVRNIAALLPIP